MIDFKNFMGAMGLLAATTLCGTAQAMDNAPQMEPTSSYASPTHTTTASSGRSFTVPAGSSYTYTPNIPWADTGIEPAHPVTQPQAHAATSTSNATANSTAASTAPAIEYGDRDMAMLAQEAAATTVGTTGATKDSSLGTQVASSEQNPILELRTYVSDR